MIAERDNSLTLTPSQTTFAELHAGRRPGALDIGFRESQGRRVALGARFALHRPSDPLLLTREDATCWCLSREEAMGSSAKEQQRWAEAKARQSLEAAERDEAFRAMQRAEAERIEAKTMQLRALRMAKAMSRAVDPDDASGAVKEKRPPRGRLRNSKAIQRSGLP